MEANTISLKTAAISVAAIVLIEAGLRLSVAEKNVMPLPALGIIRCLEAALLVAIVSRFEKSTDAIGLNRSKMLSGMIKGMVWSACFGVAALFSFLVLLAFEVNPLNYLRSTRPSCWPDMAVFLLVGSVIGPIAEEFFFRGVLREGSAVDSWLL